MPIGAVGDLAGLKHLLQPVQSRACTENKPIDKQKPKIDVFVLSASLSLLVIDVICCATPALWQMLHLMMVLFTTDNTVYVSQIRTRSLLLQPLTCTNVQSPYRQHQI